MNGPVMTTPPSSMPKGYRPRKRRIPAVVHLSVAAVIVNLAGILGAIYISLRVRAVTETAGEESTLLAVYYAAMLIVAVVDALLLDEIFFKGAFRRSHLQGKDGSEIQRSEADIEGAAASLQRSSVSFPVLLLLCGGLTYFIFNFANNNFDAYHSRIGRHISALRGVDTEGEARRLTAIGELSIRRDPEVIPVLTAQLKRKGEVRIWGAWALGRFSDVHPKRRRPLVDPLTAAMTSPDVRFRREAIIALSRLQWRPVYKALSQEIRHDLDTGKPLDPRLLYATGYVQKLELVPLLTEILNNKGGKISERSQRLAAWSLFQHIDQRGGREVVPVLEQRLPSASFLLRCAIIHALGYTGVEQSNLALMHAYDTATPEERVQTCEHVTFTLRPDGGDERVDLLLPSEPLTMKVLQAMGQIRATSPDVRAKVEPWLEDVIKQSSDDLERSRAQSLLDGIRLGRDDRLAPGQTVPKKP